MADSFPFEIPKAMRSNISLDYHLLTRIKEDRFINSEEPPTTIDESGSRPQTSKDRRDRGNRSADRKQRSADRRQPSAAASERRTPEPEQHNPEVSIELEAKILFLNI